MPEPWEQEAACKGSDIELWFGTERPPLHDKRAIRSKQQTREAKAICARCPVLDECRQWAMESGIPFGLVGMMTEPERKRLSVQDQTAWHKFWKQQDKAMGRHKRMGGDHNANKTHCKHGHEYTPENTSVSNGRRHCLTCQKRRTTQYRLQLRAKTGRWDWEDQAS
jgi:WhiB family transcriptional regulator, redox-sensing transcriptional regulator